MGTTKIPSVPQAKKQCLITLFTRFKGDTSELCSPVQLNAKASTPEVPGVWNLELNLFILKFSEFAKWSKEWSPNNPLTNLKKSTEAPQSS